MTVASCNGLHHEPFLCFSSCPYTIALLSIAFKFVFGPHRRSCTAFGQLWRIAKCRAPGPQCVHVLKFTLASLQKGSNRVLNRQRIPQGDSIEAATWKKVLPIASRAFTQSFAYCTNFLSPLLFLVSPFLLL